MRYELSDSEWTAIKPMLPNKPRGVRRVNNRCVLVAKRSFDVESDDPVLCGSCWWLVI
jgi:transposase